MMQLNVLKITEFLNRFDTSTRYRLAKLDEKLAKLERTMDVVEASRAWFVRALAGPP